MANATKSLQSAVSPLVAGVAGAAAGHFVGKGKNLLLGAGLALGADFIAPYLPKAITATDLRTAGTVALLVTPAAPSSSSQTLAEFAKDGVNRLKRAGNALVTGTGLAKGPFSVSGPVETIAVEGIDYMGESPYYLQAPRATAYVQPQMAMVSSAGR